VQPTVRAVPTGDQLIAAVDAIVPQISGSVPPMVQARVERIVNTVRETIPRLNQLGAGSRDAHSVMATVTSYLPEALDTYRRLPRSFADRRPIDGGKTALMILIDQLDLLAVTMTTSSRRPAVRTPMRSSPTAGSWPRSSATRRTGGELNLG